MPTEKQVAGVGSWPSRHPQVSGALLLLALHALFILGPHAVAFLGVGAGIAGTWPGNWAGIKPEAAPLLIGIVQLFYVIPATLLALKLRHPAVAKGIVKAAVVTFLLNLAGCGFFGWQLSKING